VLSVHATAGGSVVRVRVQPGASRTGLVGIRGDALQVRVRAKPVDEAANRALLTLLAEVLGVRSSALSIAGGGHARDKRIHVEGLTADAVRQRLDSALCVDKPTPRD